MPNEDSPNNDFHPILFDSLTADDIRTSALCTEGAAGLSGSDAMNWNGYALHLARAPMPSVMP